MCIPTRPSREGTGQEEKALSVEGLQHLSIEAVFSTCFPRFERSAVETSSTLKHILSSGLAAKEVKRATSLARRAERHNILRRCVRKHLAEMIGDMFRSSSTTFDTIQSIYTHIGSEGLTPLSSSTSLGETIKMCIRFLPPLLSADAPNLLCEQGSLVPVKFYSPTSFKLGGATRLPRKGETCIRPVSARNRTHRFREAPGGQGRFRIHLPVEGSPRHRS